MLLPRPNNSIMCGRAGRWAIPLRPRNARRAGAALMPYACYPPTPRGNPAQHHPVAIVAGPALP